MAPLTSAGIARVGAKDAGAAGGVVNVAHQIGGSVGLGITVAVFTAVMGAGATNATALAHAEGVSLMVATAMLALSLLTAIFLIVRPATATSDVGAPAAPGVPEAPVLPQLPARPVDASFAHHHDPTQQGET